MGESGLFVVAQVIRPVTFMSIHSICFPSNSFFLLFRSLGNGDDEGVDGTVSEARGDHGVCMDKGRANGG